MTFCFLLSLVFIVPVFCMFFFNWLPLPIKIGVLLWAIGSLIMFSAKHYEKKQQEKGFYTSMAYIYTEPVIHTGKTERDKHFEIKINKAGSLSTKKNNLYSFLLSEKNEYTYKLSKILSQNENEDYCDGFVLLVKDSKTGEDEVWTFITNSSNSSVKKHNKSTNIKMKDAYKASPDVTFDKIADIIKKTKCFYLYVEK